MPLLVRGGGDSPSGLSWEKAGRSLLRSVAAAVFAVYIVWNIFWLTQGRLGPALFKTLTQLPCATTGMTRSLRCLLAGQWLDSAAYNLFTVPTCLLFAISLGWVGVQLLRRRRPALPALVGWGWLAVFSAAWIFKLAGPVAYW